MLFTAVYSAAAGGAASSGIAISGGGDKDKDKASGGGLLVGRKRARLLPERPFEKITPESGE